MIVRRAFMRFLTCVRNDSLLLNLRSKAAKRYASNKQINPGFLLTAKIIYECYGIQKIF